MKALLLLLLLTARVASAEVVRLEVPGGWYGEGRTDRHYGTILTNQFVQTSFGRVELPRYVADGREIADNVLGLRVTPTGPFKMAGQSHAGLGTWEWADGLWRIVGPSYGVNPVIYDWAGVLHIGALPFGSQGFRYATYANVLVTGDATYADPARAIWEFSTYGDVTVGQGEAGCISIRGTDRRMLEPGDCRFVRYTRVDDRLALTFVKQLEGKTVFLWLSVSDLAGFPPETPVTIPPPEICGDGIDNDGDSLIDEGCPPVEQPSDLTPAQVEHFIRNQIDVIAGVKRDYPSLRGAEIIDQAIHRLNKQNATDRYGRKARQSDGGNPNDDVITLRLANADYSRKKMIDALGNAHPGDPNAPEDVPQWGVVPADQEPGNGFWRAAAHPDRDGTNPDPDPDPELEARVTALEGKLAALGAQLTAARATVLDLGARVVALEERPNSGGVQEQRVRDLILDYFARAVVEGSTGRTYGHGHGLNLGITIR